MWCPGCHTLSGDGHVLQLCTYCMEGPREMQLIPYPFRNGRRWAVVHDNGGSSWGGSYQPVMGI